MNIYVDPLTPCLPNRRWRYRQSCHLFQEPGRLDELHRFAAQIGLKRDWFQNRPGRMPHYDLTGSKRHAAIRAGALRLDWRGTGAMIRRWLEFQLPNSLTP